jgi:hypothetical protein
MLMSRVCETFDYKIAGGSEYGWNCFGPNARFLDFESDHAYGTCIFDSTDQTVYSVEVSSRDDDIKPYRWLNPDYLDALKDESLERNVPFDIAYDDCKWVTLDEFDDFVEKARAIFNGREFDPRVKVDIDLDDREILVLALEAHRRDITINKMVEIILQEVIDKHNGEKNEKTIG